MSRFLAKKLHSLEPYTPGEQPQNMAQLIKLNTNENPYPPSPKVLAAINQVETSKLRLYSDPNCTEFISQAADYCGVSPENILPGNGSDEVLAFIFHALCGGGAVFPDISYGFYTVFAGLFGVPFKKIPLREDFSICVDDFFGDKATLFIANPNAPTGLILPLSEIKRLLEQDRDRLVVIDEAYIDFGSESAVRLLDDYDNLLITRTMSKSHSLAGARLGYAIGSKEIIADLNSVRYSFNPYNLDRLALIAGKEALADREYNIDCRDKIICSRDYTSAKLRSLGFTVLESSANFVFAGDCRELSGREYYLGLRENGILIRHFSVPRCENYVRISIGTQEQMKHFIKISERLLFEKAGGKR